MLLDLLAPVHSELSALRSRGAEFDFFCFVGSNGAEHAAILTPDLPSRISEIGAELWLDIYPDDDNN